MAKSWALARDALLEGQVVALPTDTVYGLAARASDPRATDRLFVLKGRPNDVVLPVLVADLDQALGLARGHEELIRLGERFWPGALTVVVERGPNTDLFIGGDEATVGIRCPDSELVRSLSNEVGPLAVTSANRHGEDPARSAEDVRSIFGDEISVVIDKGALKGEVSTVVSVVGGELRCLRDGAIAFADVQEVLAHK